MDRFPSLFRVSCFVSNIRFLVFRFTPGRSLLIPLPPLRQGIQEVVAKAKNETACPVVSLPALSGARVPEDPKSLSPKPYT